MVVSQSQWIWLVYFGDLLFFCVEKEKLKLIMAHEERDYQRKGWTLAWAFIYIALFILLWIYIIGRNQDAVPTGFIL